MDDVTVGAWAARWLASRTDLKPRTQVAYEGIVRTRVVPVFGARPLRGLRPMELQEWVAAMQREGLSPSWVRECANLVTAVLEDAVHEGLLERNPASRLRRPRVARPEVQCLTAAEVERLAGVIAAPYGVLVHVLAYGGLRFGEAAALRRARCHLDAARLEVRESLSDVNGRIVFGTTKTGDVRRVVIPGFVVAALRDHLRDEVGPEPDALVFTSTRGAPVRYANFHRRVWRPATVAIGRPTIGLHVLRHTCASLLIGHGAPILAVQAQLGHRSAEMTLDRYGHLYPDQLDVLAARMDEARAAAVVDR